MLLRATILVLVAASTHGGSKDLEQRSSEHGTRTRVRVGCGEGRVLSISEPQEGAWYSVRHGLMGIAFAASLEPASGAEGAVICVSVDAQTARRCAAIPSQQGGDAFGEIHALADGPHVLTVSVGEAAASGDGALSVIACTARVAFTSVGLGMRLTSAEAAAWLQPSPIPRLDFEPIPHAFGRVDRAGSVGGSGGGGREPRRSLVVTFASGAAQAGVSRAMAAFPPADFSFFVFVYDASDWSSLPWARNATIVHVRGQMKWWYVKRFLHPELVATYEYVLLLDDDVSLSGFDPVGFVRVMREHGVGLAQPAHAAGSSTSAQYAALNAQRAGVVGVWTNFVEIGARTWACMWACMCVYVLDNVFVCCCLVRVVRVCMCVCMRICLCLFVFAIIITTARIISRSFASVAVRRAVHCDRGWPRVAVHLRPAVPRFDHRLRVRGGQLRAYMRSNTGWRALSQA
jgi:hypothetical protein